MVTFALLLTLSFATRAFVRLSWCRVRVGRARRHDASERGLPAVEPQSLVAVVGRRAHRRTGDRHAGVVATGFSRTQQPLVPRTASPPTHAGFPLVARVGVLSEHARKERDRASKHRGEGASREGDAKEDWHRHILARWLQRPTPRHGLVTLPRMHHGRVALPEYSGLGRCQL